MSNPQAWRGKGRTPKPNARQKRNGLFLDANPTCQACWSVKSEEAHHELPLGDPRRYRHEHMKALCRPCHVELHRCIRVQRAWLAGQGSATPPV